MKLSNAFTLARALFAPVFLVLFFLPEWTRLEVLNPISACLMIPLLALAEFTDYLDGHCARKRGEVSDFGKLFDPFADVVLHLTTFACCVKIGRMPMILFMLILYREFGMNFVRMVAARQGVAIAARKGGKFKTVLYIFSAFLCIFFESLCRLGIDLSSAEPALGIALPALFSLCVAVSYASFADYLRSFRSVLREG